MKSFILCLGIALLLWVSAYGQFCEPPGEVVGTTLYPIQSLWMTNNRIAMDESGGVDVVWTAMYGFEHPRYVAYNYRYGFNDWMVEEGVIIDFGSGDGFPSLGLSVDNRAVVAFHNAPYEDVKLAIDMLPGFGIFNIYDPPESLPDRGPGLWPYLAVSSLGDIHIISTEWEPGPGDYRAIIYTRSEDEGESWIDPLLVDTVTAISATITASSNGEVAIAYLHPTDNNEDGEYMNNVCFIKSSDGRSWTFYNPLCFTDYENEDPEIRALGSIDAVMDLEGNLHVIWLTEVVDEDGNLVTQLWHFCDRTWDITRIARMTDADLTCEPGWMQIDSPTISIDSSGAVEVIYVGYVDNDVSSEGGCVGDLYMVYGADRGQNWLGPFNITETHSDGCLPGDCLSESQPSTAEIMADSVYLTYILQKFGDIQDTVYYMPVEVPTRLDVNDREDVPRSFKLYGNYPNPFNAGTTIRFEIEENSYANLAIYNITGAKVATLVDGEMEAGVHSASWNADGFASGVYYYRLTSGSGSHVKKMVFLK